MRSVDTSCPIGPGHSVAKAWMRRPHSTIYDTSSGRLLVQSPDIAPLGLSLTRGEIALLLASSQPSDITTPYGRLRIVNSPIAGPGGRTYLLQVGVSLRTLDARSCWQPQAHGGSLASPWPR
jgi:hypothetical protein